jgi:hypothetical protein
MCQHGRRRYRCKDCGKEEEPAAAEGAAATAATEGDAADGAPADGAILLTLLPPPVGNLETAAPAVGNLETAAPAAEGAAAAKAKAAADGAPPKAKRKPNRELESLRSKATEKKKRRKPNKSKGETWYCENCGECVHVLLVRNPEHEHDGYCEYCSTHLYVEITII